MEVDMAILKGETVLDVYVASKNCIYYYLSSGKTVVQSMYHDNSGDDYCKVEVLTHMK